MDTVAWIAPLIPLVLAAFALGRGSKLALVSVGVFLFQAAWAALYYATDLIDPIGMEGVWKVWFLPTLASLVIALVAVTGTFRKA